MARQNSDDDEPSRWREADEDADEPRDWEEVEPEEEKEDRQPVLSGHEPVARFVFLAILGCVLLGGAIAFIFALAEWIRR